MDRGLEESLTKLRPYHILDLTCPVTGDIYQCTVAPKFIECGIAIARNFRSRSKQDNNNKKIKEK